MISSRKTRCEWELMCDLIYSFSCIAYLTANHLYNLFHCWSLILHILYSCLLQIFLITVQWRWQCVNHGQVYIKHQRVIWHCQPLYHIYNPGKLFKEWLHHDIYNYSIYNNTCPEICSHKAFRAVPNLVTLPHWW